MIKVSDQFTGFLQHFRKNKLFVKF